MLKKVVLISGGAAVGKTAVLKNIIPLLQSKDLALSVCKIDCVLLIETAGLCHRCSPATEQMAAGCVLDCTSSCHAPAQLGPMLTYADFVVLTKIDMVSQAEREIILWKIKELNPTAKLFTVDGLTGYGAEGLADWLSCFSKETNFDDDVLRHSMPSGVCSYCVGEKRVGSAYQVPEKAD